MTIQVEPVESILREFTSGGVGAGTMDPFYSDGNGQLPRS